MRAKQELTYVISEKHFVAVVNFRGPLQGQFTRIIENCEQDLRSRKINWVILNFQEVPEVEFIVVPQLARLQKAIRETVVGLRMCSLNRSVMMVLGDRVLLRPGEVYRNLPEAMKSLPESRALSTKAA